MTVEKSPIGGVVREGLNVTHNADRPSISVSRPKTIHFHEISEDELSLLCEGNGGTEQDITLAAVGVFAGSIINTWSIVGRATATSAPSSTQQNFAPVLSAGEIWQIAICAAAFALMLVCGVMRLARGNRVKKKRDEIRGRSNNASQK